MEDVTAASPGVSLLLQDRLPFRQFGRLELDFEPGGGSGEGHEVHHRTDEQVSKLGLTESKESQDFLPLLIGMDLREEKATGTGRE